jgi:hypothetical protein
VAVAVAVTLTVAFVVETVTTLVTTVVAVTEVWTVVPVTVMVVGSTPMREHADWYCSNDRHCPWAYGGISGFADSLTAALTKTTLPLAGRTVCVAVTVSTTVNVPATVMVWSWTSVSVDAVTVSTATTVVVNRRWTSQSAVPFLPALGVLATA